jgi:hypothetical protein
MWQAQWQQVQGFFQSINWSAPSWDVFILLFFAIGALLYGLSLGRDRIIAILVSLYMAMAVAKNTPMLAKVDLRIDVNGSSLAQVAFFLGIFVVTFFLISRSALLKTLGNSGAPGSWWQTIVFSILQVGLLISMVLAFLPPEATSGLSQMTKDIFMGDQGRSVWMVLPIVFMILAPKQKEDIF